MTPVNRGPGMHGITDWLYDTFVQPVSGAVQTSLPAVQTGVQSGISTGVNQAINQAIAKATGTAIPPGTTPTGAVMAYPAPQTANYTVPILIGVVALGLVLVLRKRR